MGEVFAGRFELLEPIAEGGMGSVWRVLDHRDGQVYAAKLLRQTDASSLLRFMREQATRIDHAHVVTPLSWAGEDDRILFTMPLVAGGSVHSVIRRYGRLPQHWVAVVLDQVLDALTEVHGAGVVHRDVKPANILLEATGADRPYARLTDFGVAVPLDQPRLTQVASAIGTPGYMPPEQEAGADPDPRQDLYAVGVVGLEMLTGRRPPRPGSGEEAPTLPGSPFADALRRAADPDPAMRPANAAEFRSWIAGALPPPGQWDAGGVFIGAELAAEPPPTAVEWAARGTKYATEPPGPPPGYAPTAAVPVTGGRSGGAAVVPMVLAVLGVLLLAAAVAVLLTG